MPPMARRQVGQGSHGHSVLGFVSNPQPKVPASRDNGQVRPPQGAVYDPGRGRYLQTHMVASGRLKISAFEDLLPDGSSVLRASADGAVVARRTQGGWSRPVKEARERMSKVVTPQGPAVTVALDKGRYY